MTAVTGRRGLLLTVAGLLVASAVLAVAILLFGDFGETEGRILGTTAVLAGYGVLALPATVLLDRGRLRPLAVALEAVAVTGAGLAVGAIWVDRPSDELARAAGTAAVILVAGAQASALALRRRPSDPPIVRVLFWVSCPLAAAVATMVTVLIWGDEPGLGFGRALGVLAVCDVLTVALQPLLARARAGAITVRLRLTLEPGGVSEVEARGSDLGAAAAGAIRAAESAGARVVRVEIGDREAGGPLDPEREV
jgi:hypothetical protein